MKVQVQKPLFAWDCLEDFPALATIRDLLEAIPDGMLLQGLKTARGRGRNDYPVRSLWGVVVLTVALRHTGFEACLGELRRNPALAKLIGIESKEDIPKAWNVSRFLDVPGEEPHRPELQAVFNRMVQRLGEVVSDLGKHTAGDATSLNARRLRCDVRKEREAAEARAKEQAEAGGSAPVAQASSDGTRSAEKPVAFARLVRKDRTKAARGKTRSQGGAVDSAASGRGTEEQEGKEGKEGSNEKPSEKVSGASASAQGMAKIEYDRHGLPQASGGRKEYKDDAGRVTHVLEWFGYKLHLLVDTRHEVSLAYRISSTKVGDNEALPELVDQGMANLPARRIETLAYDKAADDHKVHEKLDECGIKPVIQNRALWKDETERMLPGHNGNSNIVYDEAGTLYCYDRTSNPMIRRPMAYIGHEPSRGTLKYRCPARHDGFPCAMSEVCNAGKKYGLTIRVKQEIDLRRFPPIPRATKQFERLYKGRTSVERINARLKIFWGADDGNVTGATRFFAMTGTMMIVHLSFATLLASAPRREGTLGRMKFSAIAKALRQRIAAPNAKTIGPEDPMPAVLPSH